MDREAFEVLTARLQRLEQRQRLTVIGWVLSMVMLAVLWAGVQQAMSQSSSSTIRAREFDVVDSSGRDVVALGLDTEGLGGMWVYDGQKRTRIAIGFSGSAATATSSITLYNGSAKTKIGFDNLDLPSITHYDKNGTKRTQLGFGGSDPGLWFFDGAGTNKWTAP